MTGKMTPGMTLAVDDKLVSANGKFTLWMQSDGNLVLYHNVSSSPVPYWASDTEWGPIDQHPKSLTFQADAQMVLKDDSGILRWSSGTWGPFEDPFMVLQDDGNLVIYDKYAQPIWASGVGGGLWAIPGHGYVSETGIDFTAAACGQLPQIVAGSTDIGTPITSFVDVSGVAYQVTEQRRRLVNDVVEHAFLQDLAQLGVWPGEPIQGKSLLSGDVAPIGPLHRQTGTITITTDLITNSPRTQSMEVYEPTLASITKARSDLLNALQPSDSPGILKASYESASSYKEVAVKAGLSVSGAAFGVDANTTLNQTHKKTTVVGAIRNIFYNVTFAPKTAGAKGFWQPDVSPNDLRGYCGSGNPPLFIDSVQYGRFICVTATGAYSSTDLTAAIKGHYEGSVKVGGNVDVKYKEILESSDIKIYTVGVPGRGQFQNITGVDDLAHVYQSGLIFSLVNPGAPISFTCRHIADGTLGHVGLVAEYVQPLSAVGTDVNNARFWVIDGVGGGLVDTGVHVNPGDSLTLSGSGAFWNGIVFSGDTTPAGWKGHKADANAPVPSATAYCLVAKVGKGHWSACEDGFFEDEAGPEERGSLLLNGNDTNMNNGDGRHWTVRVDVKRASAGAAGIYV